MNQGIIASRYAAALMKLVLETGRGEVVYQSVEELLAHPERSSSSLEPELVSLCDVLADNGRLSELKRILMCFVRMYEKASEKHKVRLVTAIPSKEMEKMVSDMLEKKLGGQIIMESSVDPDIIGGFVFTVDDSLVDASVSNQLALLRKQLIEMNKITE